MNPLGWLARTVSWQRVPTASLRFRDTAREARVLLIYTTAYVGASVATGLVIRAHPRPLWGATDFLQDVSYAVLFKFVLLLVVPLAIHRAWGYRARDLLHGPSPTARALPALAIAYACGVCLNLGRVSAIRAAFDSHVPVEAWLRLAMGLALPFLQAGIPEEVVFRSMLQSRLELLWGRPLAVLVTLVLFVAWHLPTRMLLAHGIEGHAGDPVSVLVGTGLPWAWSDSSSAGPGTAGGTCRC
jgi:membrane protease YdiL (CAAX protease family)